MSDPDIPKLQASGGVKRLIEVLRDGDASVRRAAAGALGKIGDVRTIRGLGTVLMDTDENPGVRKAAAKALGRMGPSAIGQIATDEDISIGSDMSWTERR